MRYLGLDLGTKTLGVSISDRTGLIANAYEVIHFDENDYDSALPKLKEIVEKEQVEKIVLGLPKHMNNDFGDKAIIATEFGNKISEYLKIDVIMQDERRSTIEATNYMLEANISRKKRKKKIDSLAANIILQTYLDRKRNENERKNDI